MAIPNRQIGWSQESNLLWNISSQLDRLTSVIANLSPGGGGGTNIYNSDGSLTGNRTLSGANNNLEFADLLQFITSVGGNNVGFKLDFATNLFSFGDFDTNYNGTSFLIDDTNQFIKTQSGGNDIGLKLDFANNELYLGDFTNSTNIYFGNSSGTFLVQYNGGSVIDANAQSNNITIGDSSSVANQTQFSVLDTAQIIYTRNQGNDLGLRLDFANNAFYFGTNFNNFNGAISIDGNNLETYLYNNSIIIGGDPTGNQSTLFIDDTNSVIKTQYLGNDIGLKLDFANDVYYFGDYNGVANNTFISISNSNAFISLLCSGFGVYQQFDGTNGNIEIASTNIIKTTNNGNDIGLKLDFANSEYWLGDKNNTSYISVESINEEVTLFAKGTNNTILQVHADYLQTQHNFNLIGLKLDFANQEFRLGYEYNNSTNIRVLSGGIETQLAGGISEGLELYNQIYRFGDYVNSNNGTIFEVVDISQTIKTQNQNNDVGILLDFANSTYQFGQLTGGNATKFVIDDAAVYPVQVSGTNVSANTAGAASGQFLKIKVGGVDYKIALLNP